MSLDHGAPIEDVQFFPSGSLAVTAGGNSLCIWDVLRCDQGRLIVHDPTLSRSVRVPSSPWDHHVPFTIPCLCVLQHSLTLCSSICLVHVHSGGKLLKRLTNFQKTVTCVRLSPCAGPAASAAPRLLAGSIDHHVKVFELDSFKVTHVSRYPAPVLSLGLSPDCSLLAVGMSDGTLSVRKHAKPQALQAGGCCQLVHLDALNCMCFCKSAVH